MNVRPSIATLVDDSGVERTYVFYRDCDTPTCSSAADKAKPIKYAWRYELPADADWTAQAGIYNIDSYTAAWQGPCQVPDSMTANAPSAAGNDTAVYVAWNAPKNASNPGVTGTLKAARLAHAGASGCNDSWQTLLVPNREIKGAPAIQSWDEKHSLFTFACELGSPTALAPSGRFEMPDVGSSNPGCASALVAEDKAALQAFCPSSSLPCDPGTGGCSITEAQAESAATALGPLFESPFAARLPTLFDPRAPTRRFPGDNYAEFYDVQSVFRGDNNAASAVNQQLSGHPIKGLFDCAMSAIGLDGLSAAAFSHVSNIRSAGGTIDGVGAAFRPRHIMLAFRTTGDELKVTRLSDLRSNADIESEATNVKSDPAMATVDGFLYVLYLGSANQLPTAVFYKAIARSESDGSIRAADFTGGRLDTISATVDGRPIDFAKLRTSQVPSIVGSEHDLHIFTVALESPGTSATPLPVNGDHIAYTVARPMDSTGTLTFVSERPVILPDSGGDCVFGSQDFCKKGGNAGAAFYLRRRGVLGHLVPNLGSLEMQTRPVGIEEN